MARTTMVALPDDDYLVLIGQMAYTVSYLEWTILGDLRGMAAYLPEDLNLDRMAGMSTGQIGNTLCSEGKAILDAEVRAYVLMAGKVIAEAAGKRNNLLHARPATIDGDQRLYRWLPKTERGSAKAFAITNPWLEEQIDWLGEAVRKLSGLRPLHKNRAFDERT